MPTPGREGTGLGAVIDVVGGQRGGHNLAGVGVHAEVQLAPRPAHSGAVLLDQPLPGPAQLGSRMQIRSPARRLVRCSAKNGTPVHPGGVASAIVVPGRGTVPLLARWRASPAILPPRPGIFTAVLTDGFSLSTWRLRCRRGNIRPTHDQTCRCERGCYGFSDLPGHDCRRGMVSRVPCPSRQRNEAETGWPTKAPDTLPARSSGRLAEARHHGRPPT